MKNIFEVQTRLKELGYYGGEVNGDKAATKSAIMNFQKDNNLVTDGIYGPNTERVLFKGEVVTLDLETLIAKVVPQCNRKLVKALVPFLITELDAIGVLQNDKRLAFFLGQCAIESDYFRTLREYGTVSYFEKMYGKKSNATNTIPPRNQARRGNLNYWYIGRGIIQNTWEANYREISKEVGVDFVESPWLLETPETAVRAAAIFWKNRDLNKWADSMDISGGTRVINGGQNHLKERTEYINAFYKVLRSDNSEGVSS